MHANLRMRVHLDAAMHPYRTKHAPSNVPFRFAIKISLRLPLISVRPSRRLEKYHRWTRMAGSARSALYDSIYIYIYIYTRGIERWSARMQMVDPEQILARKNSPWPWATLSTYYDTSKPGCGAFLGFDVRSVRVAAAPSIHGSATSYEATRYEL